MDIKKSDEKRIESVEIKFLKRTGSYRLIDKLRSFKIRKELKIDAIEGRISEYRTDWINHINRMESKRLPTIILKYNPVGRNN